ncbi:energy-coupling factor ABC transporter permease [Ferviditalea candida]|uniref:Energy-coupling factor ABC transporter permease n=1 Tax=Ferviditalea candida TaxID=3108399 RepID=A0ABU5ZLH6_9BACL|nr:energy-coupling factor ABC transporter permease [Paenibacillaceae bacterium T2]
MHIPDGFLDTRTWIAADLVCAAVLSEALRRTRLTVTRRQVPMVSLIGAFVFAAQMINFPVAGATSGHFLGGSLTSILFGPWIGSVIMTAVILVQAFVFQDGGITVLGANILCMGFIGNFLGYGIYKMLTAIFPERWSFASSFVSAWFSVVAGASAVSVLLSVSGTVPLPMALTAMAGWHVLIGIGEGLITAFVVGYLRERNIVFSGRSESADLGDTGQQNTSGGMKKWAVLVLATMGIVVFLSPFASTLPDGLDRVAIDHQFAGKAKSGFVDAPLAGYQIGFAEGKIWGTAGAGLAGVLMIMALLYGYHRITAKSPAVRCQEPNS